MLLLCNGEVTYSFAPLRKCVVLVTVLHPRPCDEKKEAECWVHHDVAVKVLMRFVKHASVVARVDHVPPAILGGIDVDLRHAEHAHFLPVPVTLQPANPMASWPTAEPDVG